MYKALIQPDVPVDNNSKIWKINIPLKTKVFAWYLCRGVILTKDNLLSEIGMNLKSVSSVITIRLLSIYSSNASS
jgi:hypothetical protein